VYKSTCHIFRQKSAQTRLSPTTTAHLPPNKSPPARLALRSACTMVYYAGNCGA